MSLESRNDTELRSRMDELGAQFHNVRQEVEEEEHKSGAGLPAAFITSAQNAPPPNTISWR